MLGYTDQLHQVLKAMKDKLFYDSNPQGKKTNAD